ncbi:hypothetical protein SAMN02949497_4191 [Methylomagnum ishizawai]|uniref:Uncharacterized protein n=1 Tax=Methylomagnum ishizawai TaxID=1760988 RepID=A0A1Y6D7M7_9GAMM|nr:bifunctional aminoglycoside phosphotransferase/ATP-binding protein [Methylomagnum ishizawai]SMF96783.1 hypothetical protein SAMN02949497_4191 [Methylomagnum ishizawai]
MPEPSRPPWIEGLLQPAAYGHPADAVQLAETHISWILLAGEFAYKIKKPVDFGFLDFSTLERRQAACQAELRLNRRHAPDLYLAVVPIVGDARQPHMGGPGVPIEYAVQMRRFDADALFETLAQSGKLRPEHIDALAAHLAAFHGSVGRATADDGHGLPAQHRLAAEFNFTQLRPLLDHPTASADLDALHTWTSTTYARLEPRLAQRKRDGFIRECHGDLHLGNIALIDGRPILFDAIEFNEELRWIDILDELAFVVMDLEARGCPALAYRLLNQYLEITGDYAGMALFDYYRLYRALVRAKIAALSWQPTGDPAQRAALHARCRRYLDYGLRLIRPQPPRLYITHGLSGSGKSQLAARLAETLPAIRLRSDVERKRLAGLSATARSDGALGAELYGPAMTARTYGRLAQLGGTLLEAGHSVVMDATFLQREHREAQRQLAERHGTRFLILDCQAPPETLRGRVRARHQAGTDASEADLAVLDRQAAQREPLGGDERENALAVDMGGKVSVETWASAIAAG